MNIRWPGSIHKGRVTRVLPGMQSAFVDIGLGYGTRSCTSPTSSRNTRSTTRSPCRPRIAGAASKRQRRPLPAAAAAAARRRAPERPPERKPGPPSRRSRRRRNRERASPSPSTSSAAPSHRACPHTDARAHGRACAGDRSGFPDAAGRITGEVQAEAGGGRAGND